jgi:hypothetical protein
VRFYNQSIRESNQHLKNWNLSSAQFDVLVQVGSHERLSQQDLAENKEVNVRRRRIWNLKESIMYRH